MSNISIWSWHGGRFLLLFLVRVPTINLKQQPSLALRRSASILPSPPVSQLPHRLPVDLIIEHNEVVMAHPVRKRWAYICPCIFMCVPPHTDHWLLLQEFSPFVLSLRHWQLNNYVWNDGWFGVAFPDWKYADRRYLNQCWGKWKKQIRNSSSIICTESFLPHAQIHPTQKSWCGDMLYSTCTPDA